MHPWIWEAAARLWDDGHRKMAIQSAATAVDNQLQAKLGRYDVAGTDLVRQSFNIDDAKVGKPKLRFPRFQRGTPSWNSAHEGARDFGAGCMQRLRNLASHEGDEPGESETLEALAALSLLARWIDEAEVETV